MHYKLTSFFFLLFFSLPLVHFGQTLKLSTDQRFIVKEDGSPFFYLGDTAWELFHRLNREEATRYLENRAEKGFTVIQAVVLAELDGLNTPNPYGEKPLINNDPTKPNEAYFEHVDFIVNKAAALGLFIGMLPTWGDKFNKQWGVGPEVFTPQNAEVYGEFLGKRYLDKPIIWILGGDRNPADEEDQTITRAMAKGIAQGDGGNHLMTYHPQGGSQSATWFHQDTWLDFNMFQSGHGEPANPNYKMTTQTYQKQPVKPVLDGEPCYEDHPINWKATNGWFDAFDSRRAGYWSMLAGACGHTYGNHNIWQMWQPGRNPISIARTPWYEALDYPGAFQAGYMHRLFASRPWQKLLPADNLLTNAPNVGGKIVKAALASDGSFLMVYTPFGSNFSVDLSKMSASNLQCWWYNPRNHTCILLKDMKNPKAVQLFDPPADEEKGNDWLLVIDDASQNFTSPAQ
jgi:hypothetical protein